MQIIIVIMYALFLSTLSLRRATARSGLLSATCQFLSTLSLRRATPGRKHTLPARHNFYPRSPCGERLHAVKPLFVVFQISIHALLAESDRRSQSVYGGGRISIHALLAESDHDGRVNLFRFQNFYPRSPCGERPKAEATQWTAL